MREDLVDIISRYSDEFGVTVEFTDTAAKFVTDDGEIVLEEKGGEANLKRVEPLDETDDDQIMRLSKIRRHFSGYLRTSLEANKKLPNQLLNQNLQRRRPGGLRSQKKQNCRLKRRNPRNQEEPPEARRPPKMRKELRKLRMTHQMPRSNSLLLPPKMKRKNCRIFGLSVIKLAKFSRRYTS